MFAAGRDALSIFTVERPSAPSVVGVFAEPSAQPMAVALSHDAQIGRAIRLRMNFLASHPRNSDSP